MFPIARHGQYGHARHPDELHNDHYAQHSSIQDLVHGLLPTTSDTLEQQVAVIRQDRERRNVQDFRYLFLMDTPTWDVTEHLQETHRINHGSRDDMRASEQPRPYIGHAARLLAYIAPPVNRVGQPLQLLERPLEKARSDIGRRNLGSLRRTS